MTPSDSKTKQIARATELSLAETLIVLDQATELPPFGFNIAGLQQRLEQRLGFKITQSAINECLLPYYNLKEWEERHVVTALGDDVEDFPGKGSGDHPPLSPLKEFYLSSDDDGSESDAGSADGGGSAGARGARGNGRAPPSRERNVPRKGSRPLHDSSSDSSSDVHGTNSG